MFLEEFEGRYLGVEIYSFDLKYFAINFNGIELVAILRLK